MFCPKCGNTLRDNAKFCGKCGQKIDTMNTATKETEVERNHDTPAPAINASDSLNNQPQKFDPKKKRNIIIIVVVAIIAIAAIFMAVSAVGAARKSSEEISRQMKEMAAASSPSPSPSPTSTPSSTPTPTQTPTVTPKPKSTAASPPITTTFDGEWQMHENGIDAALILERLDPETFSLNAQYSKSDGPKTRMTDDAGGDITCDLQADGRLKFAYSDDGWGNSGSGFISISGNTLTLMFDGVNSNFGFHCAAGTYKALPTNSSLRPTDIFDTQGMVLPDSSEQYLKIDEILSKTAQLSEKSEYSQYEVLNFARNEIFARHGYQFDTAKYADHYSKYDWYNVLDLHQIQSGELNDYEVSNIDLIIECESATQNSTVPIYKATWG